MKSSRAYCLGEREQSSWREISRMLKSFMALSTSTYVKQTTHIAQSFNPLMSAIGLLHLGTGLFFHNMFLLDFL